MYVAGQTESGHEASPQKESRQSQGLGSPGWSACVIWAEAHRSKRTAEWRRAGSKGPTHRFTVQFAGPTTELLGRACGPGLSIGSVWPMWRLRGDSSCWFQRNLECLRREAIMCDIMGICCASWSPLAWRASMFTNISGGINPREKYVNTRHSKVLPLSPVF